jgi:hypothetical protein
VSLLAISRHSKLNVVSVSVPSLYLDPQIRDWVLFPITLVMVCGHPFVAMLVLICWITLDTRRGVKALRRGPFTIIADKAPTGSYPRAVRTHS